MFYISAVSLLWTCIRIVNALGFSVIQMRINYAILYAQKCRMTGGYHQLCFICDLNSFSDLSLCTIIDVVFSECFSLSLAYLSSAVKVTACSWSPQNAILK